MSRHDMCVKRYPFLSVWIFDIVDGRRVPQSTDAKELHWPETILGHDDVINKKSAHGFYDADLTEGHGNQPKQPKVQLFQNIKSFGSG